MICTADRWRRSVLLDSCWPAVKAPPVTDPSQPIRPHLFIDFPIQVQSSVQRLSSSNTGWKASWGQCVCVCVCDHYKWLLFFNIWAWCWLKGTGVFHLWFILCDWFSKGTRELVSSLVSKWWCWTISVIKSLIWVGLNSDFVSAQCWALCAIP